MARIPKQMLVPSTSDLYLDLDQNYVSVGLKASNGARISDLELSHSFNKRGRVALILGEPGSGKSTLTKILHKSSCIDLYQSPRSMPFPVEVDLGSIDWTSDTSITHQQGWLRKHLEQQIGAFQDIYSATFLFETYLQGTGIELIADSLDEVPSHRLNDCCDELASLVRELTSSNPCSNIFVFGRVQLASILSRTFMSTFQDVYHVQAFSMADVYEFVEKWPFHDRPSSEGARVFRDIQATQSIREMCSNPLVLSMYVARDQFYAGDSVTGRRPIRLPDRRTSFYDEIVNELLFYRRRVHDPNQSGSTRVLEERRSVLGKIALSHALENDEPTNSLSRKKALEITQEELALPTLVAAESYLSELSVDTGLFVQEKQGESLRFMHQTLGEYLAAREMREQDPGQLITLAERFVAEREHPSARKLTELLVFACGLVGRQQRKTVLDVLLADIETAASSVPLRIMLESEDYNSEHLRSASKAVVDSGGFVRSPVRLLYRVLKNASDRSRAGGECPSKLSTFIRETRAEIDVDPLEVSFTDLMEVDPRVAVEEAVSAGRLDLLDESKIWPALNDPEVVEFAIQQLVERPLEKSLWQASLLEAALNHRLVAMMLNSVREWGCMRSVEAPDRGISWSQLPPVIDSFYASLLDATANSTATLSENLQLKGLRRAAIVVRLEPELKHQAERGDLVGVMRMLNLVDLNSHTAPEEYLAIAYVARGRAYLWASPGFVGPLVEPVMVPASASRDEVAVFFSLRNGSPSVEVIVWGSYALFRTWEALMQNPKLSEVSINSDSRFRFSIIVTRKNPLRLSRSWVLQSFGE